MLAARVAHGGDCILSREQTAAQRYASGREADIEAGVGYD
jgi:hypothetical protein